MWWRRWVSPVVGSTASEGLVRKSWARCMPRLDGDFLFCWTAMVKLLSSIYRPAAPIEQSAQVRKRRGLLPALFRAAARAVLVPRRKGNRQKNFVFDQRPDFHFPVGQYPIRYILVDRLRLDFGLALRQHQHLVDPQRERQGLQAALAGQLQLARNADPDRRPAYVVPGALELIAEFAGIRLEHVLQPAQA